MEKSSKFKIHYQRLNGVRQVAFGENNDPRRALIDVKEYYIKEYKDTFDIYFLFDTVPKADKPYYIKAVGLRNLKEYHVIENVKEEIEYGKGTISIYHCDMKDRNTFMVHEWREFEEDFFHDA